MKVVRSRDLYGERDDGEFLAELLGEFLQGRSMDRGQQFLRLSGERELFLGESGLECHARVVEQQAAETVVNHGHAGGSELS
jgi:hypothetical protein